MSQGKIDKVKFNRMVSQVNPLNVKLQDFWS